MYFSEGRPAVRCRKKDLARQQFPKLVKKPSREKDGKSISLQTR
jgi:hypothetical protein